MSTKPRTVIEIGPDATPETLAQQFAQLVQEPTWIGEGPAMRDSNNTEENLAAFIRAANKLQPTWGTVPVQVKYRAQADDLSTRAQAEWDDYKGYTKTVPWNEAKLTAIELVMKRGLNPERYLKAFFEDVTVVRLLGASPLNGKHISNQMSQHQMCFIFHPAHQAGYFFYTITPDDGKHQPYWNVLEMHLNAEKEMTPAATLAAFETRFKSDFAQILALLQDNTIKQDLVAALTAQMVCSFVSVLKNEWSLAFGPDKPYMGFFDFMYENRILSNLFLIQVLPAAAYWSRKADEEAAATDEIGLGPTLHLPQLAAHLMSQNTAAGQLEAYVKALRQVMDNFFVLQKTDAYQRYQTLHFAGKFPDAPLGAKVRAMFTFQKRQIKNAYKALSAVFVQESLQLLNTPPALGAASMHSTAGFDAFRKVVTDNMAARASSSASASALPRPFA